MPAESTVLVRATTASQVAAARELIEEYARQLDFPLDFQDFAREVSDLPGEYSPPRGRLILAHVGGRLAGCVGLRPLDAMTCEMKRLYVRPEFRGLRVGSALAERVVDEARQAGYRTMRLDTVPSMTAALALYRSIGFREIPAYRFNPLPGAIYLELDLLRSER